MEAYIEADDGGDSWENVGEPGLPSDFGFPIVAHPTDPDRAYVIPLLRGTRWSPDNVLGVYRTTDAGALWKRMNEGLPYPTYSGVLRDACSGDDQSPVGLYFGTTGGAVYGSADDGETWNVVAENLPRIYSVVAATNS